MPIDHGNVMPTREGLRGRSEELGPQAQQPDREELLGPEPRFAIVVDGALAGWLGCEENTDPMYRSVGLDIFLTTARQGQGLRR